jgi:hypothetical protein
MYTGHHIFTQPLDLQKAPASHTLRVAIQSRCRFDDAANLLFAFCPEAHHGFALPVESSRTPSCEIGVLKAIAPVMIGKWPRAYGRWPTQWRWLRVSESIKAGLLVKLFADYKLQEGTVHVLRPPGTAVPAKTRALIDLMVEFFDR